MTLFLTGIAFSTAFLVARSKTSMKSVSQTSHCPMLAREILEQFTSFGTRLYGYKYDGSLAHTDGHPKYGPLLIKPDTSASPPVIKDMAGHSRSSNPNQLKFPEIFEKTLENLPIDIPNGSNGSWFNTGVDIIKTQNNQVELGSSVFIINTINVLQYLYNSDQSYFTGTRQGSTEVWGKMWSTIESGSALEKYKKQFDLTDLNVYLLIRPVEMGTGKHNVLTTESDVQTKCQTATANGHTLTRTNYTCPQDGSHYLLLTRPRLTTAIIRQIPYYVVLHGNPDLGFELKVTIEYQKSDSSENLYCDTMQTFTHQMYNSVDHLEAPSYNAYPEYMENKAAPTPRNLKRTNRITNPDNPSDPQIDKIMSLDANVDINDPLRKPAEYVSCDTDGVGYDDIILGLKRTVFSSPRIGTLLLCRGTTGCVSGDGTQSVFGCTYQTGQWTRCHQIQFPGQTTKTKVSSVYHRPGILQFTFEDLPTNRRYDIDIAEISMQGILSHQKNIARFYLDARRPEIRNRKIKGDDVGTPTDHNKGREYKAYHNLSSKSKVLWDIPTDAVQDKWLQCNQADVEFESQLYDQFTHNFRPCKRTASRRDGDGTTDQTSNLNTLDFTITKTRTRQMVGEHLREITGTGFNKCNGKLSSIQHGRQTITLLPYDSCGKSTAKDIAKDPTKDNAKNMAWDTDLPSTFTPQDFPNNPIWFKNSKSPEYSIKAVLPATGAGTFPKHYSVDCFEEYWEPTGGEARPDGHDNTIQCSLTTVKPEIDNGCNPNAMGIDYWHVCGGKQNKETKWGVYASAGGSCQNVPCEPELICCDGYNGGWQTNPCGPSGAKGQCSGTILNARCSNPKGGDNSQQDSNSGCPPLGLYSCDYTLPCTITEGSVISTNRSVCDGDRPGDSCSFTRSGTCKPNNLSDRSSTSGGFSGTCYSGTLSSGQSCTPDDTCHSQNTESIEIGVCDSDPNDCTKGAKDTCKSGTFDAWTGSHSTYHQWYCKNNPYKASDDHPKHVLCQRQKSCSDDGTATLNPTKTTDDLTTCTQYKPVGGKSCTINFSPGTCGGASPTSGCRKKTHLSSGNDTSEICEVDTQNSTRMPATSVKINGKCGPNKHTCVHGTLGTINDSLSQWSWTCIGSNGGSTSNCSQPKPCPPPKYPTEADCQADTNGNQVCIPSGIQCWEITDSPACGLTQKTCRPGTMSDTLEDTDTHYKWQCTHGGNTIDCEQPKEGPQCGTDCLTCDVGTVDDDAVADDTNFVNWSCSHNGQTLNTCQVPKATCDLCDNSKKLGCISGVADDNAVPDNSTHIKWRCMGKGRNVDTCQCEKTECDKDGACPPDKTYRNRFVCPRGQATNKDWTSHRGKVTWTCPGNGGTDAICFACLEDYQLNNEGTDCVRIRIPEANRSVCDCDCTCENCCFEKYTRPFGDGAEWSCADPYGVAEDSYCTNNSSSRCTCGSSIGTCGGDDCTLANQITTTMRYDQSMNANALTYLWRCENDFDDTGANCSKAVYPSCGCGSFKDTCKNGCTAISLSDTATHHQWKCTKRQYASNGPPCSVAKDTASPAPKCTCGTDYKDTCGNECVLYDNELNDTATHDQWICKKDNYADSPTCFRAKPLCRCGYEKYSCGSSRNSGTPEILNSTPTHFLWKCKGHSRSYCGSSSKTCSKPKPQCICSESSKNGCNSGCSSYDETAHNENSPDDLYFSWKCKGNDYKDSDTCYFDPND